jgi:hypothetical protein
VGAFDLYSVLQICCENCFFVFFLTFLIQCPSLVSYVHCTHQDDLHSEGHCAVIAFMIIIKEHHLCAMSRRTSRSQGQEAWCGLFAQLRVGVSLDFCYMLLGLFMGKTVMLLYHQLWTW